ncbi:MAG TPA: hypothetical protein VGG02_00615 [Chthoniobacterales bacterium]|jgi:hypothetical protein
MATAIGYHFYDLQFRESAREKAHGALLRYAFDDGRVGFASLPAWPQLGDLSVSEKLRGLRADPRLEPQWSWALLDAKLRAENKPALPNDTILPASHLHLWGDDLKLVSRWEEFVRRGERCWKIKISPSSLRTFPLADLARFACDHAVKLRLDANGSFNSRDEIDALFEMIAEPAIVDFFEDPSADEKLWGFTAETFGVALASDWIHPTDYDPDLTIYKPTRDPAPNETKHFVVTTAFDHSLGLNFTAWRSLELLDHPRCRGPAGILHPGLYTCDGRDSEIAFGEPGFGCGELLGKILWTPL